MTTEDLERVVVEMRDNGAEARAKTTGKLPVTFFLATNPADQLQGEVATRQAIGRAKYPPHAALAELLVKGVAAVDD